VSDEQWLIEEEAGTLYIENPELDPFYEDAEEVRLYSQKESLDD